MTSTSYDVLVEERLTSEQLKLVVALLRVLGEETGTSLQEALNELKRVRDNFNYNTDKILDSLSEKPNKDDQ